MPFAFAAVECSSGVKLRNAVKGYACVGCLGLWHFCSEMKCKGRSAEGYERNEALERNGTEIGAWAASKWPINMLSPAPLKGGGDLMDIRGKHDAGEKETIPILKARVEVE